MKKVKERKLIEYMYEGVFLNNGKPTSGHVEAFSYTDAKARIRKMKIQPLKVKKKPKPLFSNENQKIKVKDIVDFINDLSSMFSSGIPMIKILEIMADDAEKIKMKVLIKELAKHVSSGDSLSKAMSKNKHFDKQTVEMVATGEESGKLEEVLKKIADNMNKSESLRKKLKGAMIYPISIIIVGFLCFFIMMLFVIPQMATSFKNLGSEMELPIITQMLLSTSDFITSNWLFMLIGLMITTTGIKYRYKKSESFKDKVDLFLLKIPVIGKIVHDSSIARIMMTLHIAYTSGITLPQAIDSASRTAGNVYFRKGLIDVRNMVVSGNSFYRSIDSVDRFPSRVSKMINVGEESGSLDHILKTINLHYEERVENLVNNMKSMIEPIIIVFLGGLIGFMVLGMYLPIFSMALSAMNG
jgi:type IV pilus assembly protein PilC